MSATGQSSTYFVMPDQDMEEKEIQILKTLLSDLHKYVTSHTDVNDSNFVLPSTIEPGTPVAKHYRKALDIYTKFKEMKRDMEEKEIQILKTLLSDLHNYVTSHTDVKDSNFVLPSTIEPGTPVAEHYRKALDIYTKFKEMNSEMDSDGKQLLQLFSLIIGDGEEHHIVNSERSQGMTYAAQTVLDQRKRQNDNFQHALSEIEKMKKREKTHPVRKDKKTAKNKKKRKELLKTIEENETQIQRLEDENAAVKENLKIQADSNKFIDAKWKSDRDLLQTSLAKQEIAEIQSAQFKEAYAGEVSKSQIQTKQIYDLQREREELLHRLSKLAGDMMKHENANLADLSDVDRPTKLSEAYSELYDNEWTDAFDELTGSGLTENDAVVKLLDILLVTYQTCRQITWERYQTLKSIVSTIDIVHVPLSVVAFSEAEVKIIEKTSRHLEATALEEHHGEQESEMKEVEDYAETLPVSDRQASEVRSGRKENHLTSQIKLSTGQEREIKNFWRTTTKAIKQEAEKHLYTVLLTRFDASMKDLASTSKYLTSCIDLCWKMGVQEKPMYLDINAERKSGSGMIFDLDKFRAYTKSGERVDFVVWPSLFLHEGGPILVKGIAQGGNKSDS